MTADTIDFGQAIRLLKQGARMQRRGWNGKGMYLVYVPSTITTLADLNNGQPIETMPWIGMKTADDRFVPWLASQSDVLSEDWCLA